MKNMDKLLAKGKKKKGYSKLTATFVQNIISRNC